MDGYLMELIRLNDKKRKILDGIVIEPEEFTIFQLAEDGPMEIEVEPLKASRKKEKE